ncbi:MAG: leucyl aminopeptidase family protein [Novosphingobium sp.]|nr:leucyl aminopeptidase family protein [Novosphingobium sp.]
MTDKDPLIQPNKNQPATAIHLVDKDSFTAWRKTLSGPQRSAIDAQRFSGKAGEVAIVPAGNGDENGWSAVGGVANPAELSAWCLAKLAGELPAGTYALASGEPNAAMLGWQCAQYTFARYKQPESDAAGPRILLTNDVARIEGALALAAAVGKVRDLVNTPAQDMGPAELESEVRALAKRHGADVTVTSGDALAEGYPMVHAVGRAASRSHAPRMIELTWGKADAPRVALVGKGVCFDSGGLDIKPAAGMKLMKKDMGGAAHVIALAGLVMGANLPVRLHLLVPAAENAVSGGAFRPGDVLASRKGLSVEIGNTDAEGRLLLGDALARACEEKPDLVIDFATLTGAARVALGPDLPALLARNDDTAAALLTGGEGSDDPLWRLPLHAGYAEYMKSDIADINNSGSTPFAGAITAGLFLDRFVEDGVDWAHIDTFAWRQTAKPGRPAGGEALGLRAVWAMLQKRFG